MPEDLTEEIMNELGSADIAGAGIRENIQLPAGKYRFKVTNVYLNRSREKQRKQMVAVLEVLGNDQADDHNGSSYYKTWGLENEENFKWLNGDLTNLGIDPPATAKDLKRVMLELADIEFEATLVENKDNNYPPNCYINRDALKNNALSAGEGASRF